MKKNLPISECKICCRLKDVEEGYQKYGHDDENYFIPSAAHELLGWESFSQDMNKKDPIKTCPICERQYRYEHSYDWYSNGGEDEEKLTRLTTES